MLMIVCPSFSLSAVAILSPTECQSIRGLPCAEAHLGSCISAKGLREGGIAERKGDPTPCTREPEKSSFTFNTLSGLWEEKLIRGHF